MRSINESRGARGTRGADDRFRAAKPEIPESQVARVQERPELVAATGTTVPAQAERHSENPGVAAARVRREAGPVADGDERWAQIFAHASWGMIVCNAEGSRIERMNPAFAHMHGYTVEELAGQALDAILTEESRGKLEQCLIRLHAQGRHAWESWHVRKDGSRFLVQVDAVAVRDARGRASHHVVNLQDITSRRQMEDSLRESQAMLKRANAMGKLGSWRIELPTGAAVLSDECCDIYGLPAGSRVEYEDFIQCVYPEDRPFVNRSWLRALRGEPFDIQFRIVVDDHVKWVHEQADIEFDDHGAVLRVFGTTQDVSSLKRHEQALLRSQRSLRDLAAHHERTLEDERAHIAREIHDELGQYLTALRMDAAMLGQRFGAGNADLVKHVDAMKDMIDTTISVVRCLASSLRPGVLDMGLIPAAEWLLSGFEARVRVRCRLHAPTEELGLDDACSTAAFRILQESLTNIARHAQAREVDVRIERVKDVLRIEIRDDGVGFDTAEVRGRKTFGLMGMRERAFQFGGDLSIETRHGGGTTVRVRIPCGREGAP